MITFLLCLSALIGAYFVYGKYLDRQAGIDREKPTPARRMADGVDYIRMPRWRTFLIQLLNIAGTGPIFGAILGACFGPVAFIWITLGGIFFGAMHDYMSGMMIVRGDGRSLPEIIGRYLGPGVRDFVRVFSIFLMVLVGAVFLLSPAQLLGTLVPSVPQTWWVGIILVYYVVATMLPVDKVIGKLYPIFGAALIMMALGLLGALLVGDYGIPEMTTFHNYQLDPHALPIIPAMFITIACGAISGFHATQSPMMARCVGNEKECRMVFYGAMISESVIALIWAAVAMAFFGGAGSLSRIMAENGNNPAWAVDVTSRGTLGAIGSVLAMLGVVAAPITSGDTAFRSARLMIADIFNIDQRPLVRRFMICLPLFAVGFGITLVDFGVLWRYFAWANQTLGTIVLWSIVVWLASRGRNYVVAMVPAVCMTYVITSFMFIGEQFLGMQNRVAAYALAGVATLLIAAVVIKRILPYLSKKRDLIVD
ncbi:carbon starvation protein A [Muribaculum intestinale]|uniref:Carbon starvation protein A n=1 Tax=Muribaculum intestinale TaxID=1796646 RepID=A0A1B1SAZ5_9BACT|nr:carbon starvation CstA family protein [Muribaculum intestinale]ANU63961.1 carbon starvation protein A [Muribaculum intestinale]ASB37944.1 carbon starvation protein A [Muribaculum intestinale]PWB04022.1 carbon starvation protein A [Muribaculum intestinale]PWB10751.1 carbon starvation protein A [Muribaculum intestinale]QQR08678.1 carbon starvation protein A [Muribaculum intestinale]